jgi:DNA invertase Pin-like site-specific DNA recombinase
LLLTPSAGVGFSGSQSSGTQTQTYLGMLWRIPPGRPPTIDAAKVATLKAEGLGATEIAKRLKIGRASVYRVLAS